VLVALAACCWFGEPVCGTRWILEFGQLSLWSYTVHLILVYGSGLSFGIDALRTYKIPPFTEGFPPWAALICLAIVLSVTAWVVRWRAKSLQRQAALRMMPAP
jgi:drug/metabolite transporter (DMT)-like permease